MRGFRIRGCVVALLIGGCMPPLEEQVKKSPNSIMRKTTQDIGKFDPKIHEEVPDHASPVTNPITGPLEAYGPAVAQLAKMRVDADVKIFEATNSRFPTYEEFMKELVKGNGMQLPVLPAKLRYMYDEEGHRLVIVQPEAPAKPEKPDVKSDDKGTSSEKAGS